MLFLLVECGILAFGIQNPSSTHKTIGNPVPGIRNPRGGIQNPESETVFTWGEKRQLGPTQGVPSYLAVCLIEVSIKRESTVYGGA